MPDATRDMIQNLKIEATPEAINTLADICLALLDRIQILERQASRGAAGKSLPHLPGSVGADDHHGGLPQLLGQGPGETLASPKQGVAVEVLGGEDLDDVGVLQLSGPEAAGLGEGRPDEFSARQVHQGALHDLGADPLARLVGEVRPDVQPNGTSGVVSGHTCILPKLKARGKYRTNHCYLYFEVDRDNRLVQIETSWLPNLPPVQEALVPLGFTRAAHGSWSTRVKIDDSLGAARRVTRAFELLLTEATKLIESNSDGAPDAEGA